ncbi:hypothetical protein B0A49_10588, partial [Cryomyces minteri]
MAWGQVAAVSGDEVLNIILLRLIDFLGHSNPLISGLAFDELSQLSTTLNQKPEVLLRPFWRSIGITVLKDLQTRPQKAQHLSDWLDMSVNQFLLLTQTETLPYLVLTKKGHVLQRIAAARGSDTAVLDLCMQPRTNLAAILALLFLQPSPDIERFALNTFCEVVPKLSESDLLGLIKLEATLVACEMLKAAGDEDSSRKPKVHQAIQSFVSLAMQKGGLSKGASRQTRLLASFFDQHVLGIMAHFSDIIGDGLVIQPTAEKKRSLRAIEEMINIAKTHVSIALPQDIGKELLTVLEHQGQGAGHFETTKACSENVFQVLDYFSRWMQEKNKELAHMRNVAARMGQSPPELEELTLVKQISSVERVLSGIPAEVIARRAVECGSYARALFHWEQYVRQQKKIASDRGETANEEFLYQRLQDIYTQIDEPDGIEGISTHLHVLDPDQQVLDHRKAGRWTAAQSWYELELATKPDNVDVQTNLLTCLRESGQFDALLKYVESFDIAPSRSAPQVLSFASEASWMTEKFDLLRKHVTKPSEAMLQDFNVGIGKAMVKILDNDQPGFLTALSSLREGVAKGFSNSNTSSLQTCHDHMLKLHALYEIESLSGLANIQAPDPDRAFDWEPLDRRLAILGSYMPDKQYLLGIRRAVMKISKLHISELDRASSWLTSARLARKAGLTNTAFNAVLHATQLGDDSAKIEHSRLLWKDGHHRKAIQNLEGAIAVNAFRSHDKEVVAEASHAEDKQQQQNMLTARAHLLLAKWLDTAGQTQSQVITNKYQFAAKTNARWDKGHYYLGKHYNKLLESEKALPRARQSMSFLCGETAKLVIDNYMRSLAFGSKYWYQTVPKILTLWLELGMDVHNASRPAASDVGIADQRIRILDLVHRQLRKYIDRLPAYIFYTALPQIISRISHPNMKVYEVLSTIILKIVSTHPSQALWSLLAVVKSSSHERAGRGLTLDAKRNKSEAASLELRNMIAQGQKLSDHLLQACEVHIESRASTVSLSKDLGFSHRLAPSTLVIPIESTLTATLPTVHNSDYIRRYKAFPQDRVTISSFSDDVLVLASLQRPRKLTVRGSDGKNYGLLCKPKDDLRKDQRLMEFNAMINRALKRDAESSKRRLYIKTYGVTPLSEESGTIEWVDHIKPMRDILLKLYARKGVTPNYNELRTLLTEASADQQNVAIFTEKVLPQFPPTLHEYFVETFPEPEAWFAARLRYARTCAVMSMVGHVLGLGDRHGENILLEESTGGVFHVDFNCLFDKGLTFEKPELVPFRLTHNMVDAMGAYGYEGPFRKSAELTMEILRQNEETLMTILETFVYDPTTDFVGKKKRPTPGVPDTPQEVLESVRSKLR